MISAVLYLLFQIVCRVCSLALCDFSCVVFTVSDCVPSVFPGPAGRGQPSVPDPRPAAPRPAAGGAPVERAAAVRRQAVQTSVDLDGPRSRHRDQPY